ncbi:MAG: hypothetical protein O7G30_14925 [Proteobacteria bacterium]|nr:hypothetical protein [Pseudomonadota bacterium]
MRRVRATLLALLCAFAPPGCAYRLVSKGELRPALFENVLERTERARGIEADRPVDARVIDLAEMREILIGAFESEWSPGQIDAYREGLVTVGLWPAEEDLLDVYVSVMVEEVAGFYLPSGSAIYIVRDARSSFGEKLLAFFLRRDLYREFVVAHELVHLLQHQAYPRLLDPGSFRDQDDVGFAIQAAVEGDALRYGFEALERRTPLPRPDEVLDAYDEYGEAGTQSALAEAPALIRLTLGFPYAHGYALSHREAERLMERPPVSTEQVLHPEARREPFQAIDLEALRALLPAGCRFVYENSMGELGMSVLFRDLGDGVSPDAWAGWDGDRYLAAACDGRREFAWLTTWDSETDAIEFALAYEGIAPGVAERAELGGPPLVTRDEKEVRVLTPGLVSWSDSLGSLARRAQVGDLAELEDFFEGARPAAP